MTTLAIDVPQGHRIALRLVLQPGHAGNPLGDLALRVAAGAQPTQVAFNVGGKHCHAGVAERLGEALQGHGLARTGGTGNQAMAVAQAQGLSHRLPRQIGT